MKGNRRLIVILVLATVVLGSVQVVGAETAQSWHLLNADYEGTKAIDGTNHLVDVYMNKTGNTTTSPYSKYLNYTETMWWYAEYAAECDLTFGTGNWTVYLDHEKIDGAEVGETITAGIYKVRGDGTATLLATRSKTAVSDSTNSTIECGPVVASQDFDAGERLALRINWTCTTEELMIYYYRASDSKFSNIASPSTDPGYPVPELSTLILFSTGLLALAGYVELRRKNLKLSGGDKFKR